VLILEFRISNNTAENTVLCLEPWGGIYKVPSGRSLRVVIRSPVPPVLEWELAEDTHPLIVHDPAGASAIVYDGDRPLLAE
jgi:hypothetical protein